MSKKRTPRTVIITEIIKNPTISNEELASIAGCTVHNIHRIVRDLRLRGLLHSIPRQRVIATDYIDQEILDAARSETTD